MEHGEIERHIYAKRALGGTIIQDIMKAFIDAMFETLCYSSKFTVIIVLNVVNGRCPGV